MRLSIIVPIYNKGKFLNSLFNSILAQGLDKSDFELLLIDDGSTDNSREIGDTFIANNPTLSVKYVYQSNAGVSAARNRGIDLAQGKYIHFMDSDDILLNKSYRYILDNFDSSNADYIGFDMKWLDLRHQPIDPISVSTLNNGDIVKTTTGINHIIETTWPSTCVLGFYRTSFLKRYQVKFPVGVMIGEDVYFNFDFFSKNPLCVMTSCKAYVYCMREQSAMTTISSIRAERWFYSYHTFLSHLVDGQHLTPPLLPPAFKPVEYKML